MIGGEKEGEGFKEDEQKRTSILPSLNDHWMIVLINTTHGIQLMEERFNPYGYSLVRLLVGPYALPFILPSIIPAVHPSVLSSVRLCIRPSFPIQVRTW